MLTKNVCERCTNQFSAFKWGCVHDEERWEKGKVVCPEVLGGEAIHVLENAEICASIQTGDAPPSWCPFFLEHILMGEGNVD